MAQYYNGCAERLAEQGRHVDRPQPRAAIAPFGHAAQALLAERSEEIGGVWLGARPDPAVAVHRIGQPAPCRAGCGPAAASAGLPPGREEIVAQELAMRLRSGPCCAG